MKHRHLSCQLVTLRRDTRDQLVYLALLFLYLSQYLVALLLLPSESPA